MCTHILKNTQRIGKKMQLQNMHGIQVQVDVESYYTKHGFHVIKLLISYYINANVLYGI